MEKLQIGEIINKLRKDRGITQEQLANFIGVSTAAVSKWEVGASYPDITLLPDLATFFNITIDRLLNYNIELTEAEVMKLYSECEGAFSGEAVPDKAIEMSKSYILKYPGSYLLKFRIGYLFFIYAHKASGEEEINNMFRYSIKLLNEVADNCNNVELVDSSLFQLGALYNQLQEYDKAIEALNKIKKSICDPNDILASIYIQQNRLKEGRTLEQRKLYKCIHEISLACIGLSNSYDKEYDFQSAERYLKLAIAIKKTLSPEGDKVMTLNNEYYHLGEAYLKHGKVEEALGAFSTMLEYLKANNINKLGDFQNVWCFNELKRGEQKLTINLYENYYKLFKQPVFDCLKDNEKFKRIIEELRNIEKSFSDACDK